jgi:hypothetical protein
MDIHEMYKNERVLLTLFQSKVSKGAEKVN